MASEAVVVSVHGIAAGGAGVARLPDGRAVFVHRTAVGDTARIRILEEKRRFARGELVDVVDAAPDRRQAPCPYYARCGGCTLEHLQYAAQLRAKATIVTDALRRIGGIETDVPQVVASPDEFRYRNRVSFTLVRVGAGRVIAGFHEINHPNRVLDIGSACLLPEQPIADVWARLRASWGPDARLLPSGRRLRLTLRAAAGGGVGLLIEGGYGAGDPKALLSRVEGLSAVWHRTDRDAKVRYVGGSGAVPEDWQDEELELSGAMFLQVNRGAAALLEEHVMSVTGDVQGQRVIDAYCGIGMHARRLARAGARVTGIELDSEAVEEARRSGEFDVVEARVEDVIQDLLPADFVIVNPPRGGLEERVPAALAQGTKRIVYVSCNPATLARDIARLGAGWQVASIRCFDLFPQTAHVETVVELRCATS